MNSIDQSRLRIELAKQNITKRSLAARLALPPSTLSTWLHGVAPAPRDLASRIEAALGLASGAISVKKPRNATNHK